MHRSVGSRSFNNQHAGLNTLFGLVNNKPMDDQNNAPLWAPLHWLTVLAQQGSYTAAAARLGVSKAAMSQHIAALERRAGVPLVRRTTRSVRLTEAGQRLVDQTRGAFEQIAQQFEQVRDLAQTPRGLLRVTAPVALSRQHLLPMFAQFLRQYPDIRLELDMSDRLSSLATEGFDLAIRHTSSVPDTHVAWPLCTTQSVLVASPAYLAECGEPAHPHDLGRHRCLHYPRGGGVSTPVSWAFEPQSDTGSDRARITVPVSGCFAANNSEALREAAASGLGIALLPDFSAQAGLRDGRLQRVLGAWRPVGAFGERLYLIRPYAAHVPGAVRALVGYLREVMGEGFRV